MGHTETSIVFIYSLQHPVDAAWPLKAKDTANSGTEGMLYLWALMIPSDRCQPIILSRCHGLSATTNHIRLIRPRELAEVGAAKAIVHTQGIWGEETQVS